MQVIIASHIGPELVTELVKALKAKDPHRVTAIESLARTKWAAVGFSESQVEPLVKAAHMAAMDRYLGGFR